MVDERGSDGYRQDVDCSAVTDTYWESAPLRYRCRYDRVSEHRAPLDPFKVELVDPADVVHFTGREHPPWENRKDLFGTSQGGDWDQPPNTTTHEESPFYLIDEGEGEEITDTINFRAFEQRFLEGLAWEDTDLVRKIFRHIERGDGSETYWHGCSTKRDVLDRCAYLESVYEDIRENGFKTQMEVVADDPESNRGFLDAVAYEIAVDVGRNGELFLVTGRHRLSISKVLGLDEVPVAFYVRHEDWMDRRESTFETGGGDDHPDLRELRDGADTTHRYTWLSRRRDRS